MTHPKTEEPQLPEDPASAPETVLLEGAPLALEPQPEAEAPPVRFTMRETVAPVARKGGASLLLAGVGLALFGAALAGAPHVSVKAARLLAPLGAPELYGGLLIGAGLVLYIGGVLRRSLSGIRNSLADLRTETSRLDQVSHDTQNLCSTVDQVQASNEESKTALASLQKRIERLTEIASDPDHTVSMFRLAASVDQLGARLDLFIKEQFKSMNQQLGGAVGQAQQIERNLLGKLAEFETQIGAQVGKQLTAQRQALTEGFERTAASTARASSGIEANLTAAARLEAQLAEHKQALGHAVEALSAGQVKSADRIEGRLAEHKKALGAAAESLAAEQVKAVVHIEGRFAEQQQALGSTVESLGADQLKATAALQESLNGLGARFEQQLQEQTSYVAECLGQLSGTLDQSGRELAGRLVEQIAEQSSGLQQSLAPLAEAARASAGSEERVFALLADLEKHVNDQVQNLQIAMAEGLERARVVTSETYEAATDGLQAAARLEARVNECQESLNRSFAATREDWKTGMGQLGATVEREVKTGNERNSHSIAVTKRIEIEIAANSSRLERIADELRGLASLALEIRDARYTAPAPMQIVAEPPPALPVQRDTPSDVPQ